MDLALVSGVAPGREPRPVGAALKRVKVGHVLVQQPQGGVAVVGRAVARHHGVGALDQRSQPGEGRAVVVERSRGRDHGDLHIAEVVAADQEPQPGGEDSHPVARMALRRMQLKLLLTEAEPAGDRQRLNGPQGQRSSAAHVVGRVGIAQLALGLARRLAQPQRGALPKPEGQVREGEAAQHVVEVAVGGQ